MNSLAAVCITDFVKPLHLAIKGHALNENIAAYTTKGLGKLN